MIIEQIQERAAPILRRRRLPPSEPSGPEEPSTGKSDLEWSRTVFGMLAVPRAEPRRTGITAEVEELFAEAQRMPRGRR